MCRREGVEGFFFILVVKVEFRQPNDKKKTKAITSYCTNICEQSQIKENRKSKINSTFSQKGMKEQKTL